MDLRERLARLIFKEVNPWEDWDEFNTRFTDRGGYHSVQQRALDIADISIKEITLSLKEIGNESR